MRSNIVFTHKFRFTSDLGSVSSITARNIIQACGVSAATTTAGYPIVTSARIKSIELWAPPSALGANATVTCTWFGFQTTNLSELEVSDTTMSTATPAHIRSVPPPLSTAAMWFVDSTSAIMALAVPPNGIIDLVLEMVLVDGPGTVLAPGFTLVAATVGAVYYPALDGINHHYGPVGLTTA